MYDLLTRNASLDAFRRKLIELCLKDGAIGTIIQEMQKTCDEADYDMLREVCIELEIENQYLRGEYDEDNFDPSVADIEDEVTLELVAQVLMNIKHINPKAYDMLTQKWRKQ